MQLPMVDTLIGTFDIENYNEIAIKLKEKLEKKKQEAKSIITENISKIISIKIGEMTFEVLGNGKKGYAYILHNDFYEIDIAQYRSKNKDFFPISIRVKSECLWALGPEKAWDNIYEWVRKNIGEPYNNKISRIDLCYHTDELALTYEDMEKFKGLFNDQRDHKSRRRLSGIDFGSSSTNKIYCRIYDKVLEIRKRKHKNWFFTIWKEKGLDPKKVWNAEFQINREFLKEHYINTVWQALERLGTIWEYCTQKWLVKVELTNKRLTRCETNNTWVRIQDAFKAFQSEPLIKRQTQLRSDAEAFIPGAFGNITAFCARIGITEDELALKTFKMYGDKYFKSKKLTFKEAVEKKKDLINKVKENEWVMSRTKLTDEEMEEIWGEKNKEDTE